jgi:hypothetical protein
MIVELFYLTFVTAFVCLVALGHVLLFSAIYRCLRDDWVAGQRAKRAPQMSDRALQTSTKFVSETATTAA